MLNVCVLALYSFMNLEMISYQLYIMQVLTYHRFRVTIHSMYAHNKAGCIIINKAVHGASYT